MYLDPQHWVYLAQTVGGGQADGETAAEEAAEDGVQQAQRHICEDGGGEAATGHVLADRTNTIHTDQVSRGQEEDGGF